MPDNSFDVVICNHVLEHVPRYEEALREIIRIVSPQGFAFISISNPHYRRVTADWGYPKADLHGHYREFGSDIEEVLPRILPSAGILRVVGTDPVTAAGDRAYLISKNFEFLDTVTDKGVTCRFLR